MAPSKSVHAGLELLKKDPSKALGLTVGTHTITEPGQFVPRADAKSPPRLTLPAGASPSSSSGSYVVVGLDLDAPFPSFSRLGPILHWVQSGLRPAPTPSETAAGTAGSPLEVSPAEEGKEAPIASYIGPAPPPGSAPHRYVFFLYEQPDSFDGAKRFAPKDGKPLGSVARMWASLDEWEKKLGLGEAVAVNYFKSN